MVVRHEVPHRRWQKQWLIDLPGAKCLAHAQRQNLTRSSLASKINLLLRQAPSPNAGHSPAEKKGPGEVDHRGLAAARLLGGLIPRWMLGRVLITGLGCF